MNSCLLGNRQTNNQQNQQQQKNPNQTFFILKQKENRSIPFEDISQK